MAQPAFFIEEIAICMEAEDNARAIKDSQTNLQNNGRPNTTRRSAKAQR